MNCRKWICIAALACAFGGLAANTLAQTQAWPSRPIKLLVPFSAGTGPDVLARFLAEGLAEHLKVPVVVENREGAGGVIAAQAVARMPADGYTILAVVPSFLITPQTTKTAPYDPIRDFMPLPKIANAPFVLGVSGESPFKTMKDLVEYIKANPGKVNFATSGRGAQSHLEVEYIKRTLGLNAVDVPYKSAAGAVTDTISRAVTFYMPGYGTIAPHIASGKIRALALGAPQRLPSLPDVPTFIEALGINNYVPATWFGYVVAAGTPPDIVARLEGAISRAAASPARQEKIQAAGIFMNVVPAREFGNEMRAEYEKWGKLINSLGLKTD